MDADDFLGRPHGARAWVVVARPVEQTTSRSNKSGVLIALSDGEDTLPVTQVAYVRRNSKSPDTTFEDALRLELDKAQEAADTINATLDEADQVLNEKFEEAREKVAAILDRPSTAKPA